VKVLAIDGGGIRGIIPAIVLAEVERRTGRPIAELFDLLAGTSTGGILACALTRAGGDGAPAYRAEELVDLYVEEGPRIFSRSLVKRVFSLEGWIDERYEDDGLNGALRRYLGESRLKDALTPLLLTAYDIETREAVFLRSERARRDDAYDFAMWEAARATSAAPSYFEPFPVTDAAGARTYPLVDGGVYAMNPAMCAYADVAADGRAGDLEIVASLGTGEQIRPYELGRARRWGQLEWARPVLDIVFDGVADTVDFQAAAMLPPGGYVRLQTRLTIASDDLDDAGEENLRRLREEGQKLVRERAADIDALCSRLAG